MDGGSEQDLRPSKRIRLGDNFDSGIISSSSAQFDGDHGVYNQSPSNLNLKKAQNINPLISASETQHRLTIDDYSTQYTAFDRQSTITYKGNIESSPPASSTAARATSDCNNRLSITESPDQVCFGMVSQLPLEESPRCNTRER